MPVLMALVIEIIFPIRIYHHIYNDCCVYYRVDDQMYHHIQIIDIMF